MPRRDEYEPAAADGSAFDATAPQQRSPRGIERLTFPPEVVNPFVNNVKVHATILQTLKMALLGITVFPVRLTFFALFLVLAWAFAKLALLGYSDEELRNKPMKTGIFKRLVYACSRCCMFCLGYQWFESDTANWALRPDGSRKEAPVIVINHSTVCDGFLLYYTHGLHSVGVNSVADAPFFSTYGKLAQAFSLNRDDPNGRKTIGAEMLRRATWSDEQARSLGRWNPIAMFAEGTCTNQKALIQFRHGAFLPGVAVQPMVVRYPFRYCDQSWCGLDSPVSALLRLMCQFHNRLQYCYLPVYEPSEEEKQDPYLFANNVREAMAAVMCVPTTEHTYEDMRVSAVAQKLGLPWREIHCEMGYFRANGSSYEKAKSILNRFAAADTDKDGFLSKAELCNLLKLGTASAALGDAFFHVWTNGACDDHTCRGVSFRHFYFMTGLRKVHGGPIAEVGSDASPSSPEVASPVPTARPPRGTFLYDGANVQQVRCAHDLLFEQFDADGDGLVSQTEFVSVLRRSLPTLQHNSIEAETALCDLYASSGSSRWNRDFLDAFLYAHPCMAEHLLAKL